MDAPYFYLVCISLYFNLFVSLYFNCTDTVQQNFRLTNNSDIGQHIPSSSEQKSQKIELKNFEVATNIINEKKTLEIRKRAEQGYQGSMTRICFWTY